VPDAASIRAWLRIQPPNIDHLFDRSFISFDKRGELVISPVAHEDSMKKMGITTDHVVNVGGFVAPQRESL
jgi:putative restriction endonuclease